MYPEQVSACSGFYCSSSTGSQSSSNSSRALSVGSQETYSTATYEKRISVKPERFFGPRGGAVFRAGSAPRGGQTDLHMRPFPAVDFSVDFAD